MEPITSFAEINLSRAMCPLGANIDDENMDDTLSRVEWI
jgi:hypothetical protein